MSDESASQTDVNSTPNSKEVDTNRLVFQEMYWKGYPTAVFSDVVNIRQ